MSASLPTLLADKLDTSEQQAKKLLIAMLREVKKRARREGVRLPEFGTFREANGQITFEPSESLARSVNEQFEGLESEDLDTAATDEDDEEEENEGPSTITLGYQNSDWSPLDAEEEADDMSTDEDDEGADTEEFEVPTGEEAADTEELNTPDTEPAESPEFSPPEEETDTTASDTEELYPLVEDATEESPSAEASESPSKEEQMREEERDTLSEIWGDDKGTAETETGEAPEPEPSPPDAEPEPAGEPEMTFDPEPTGETEPDFGSDAESEPVHPDAQPTTEVEVEPEVREPSPPEHEENSGSSGARVMVGILVLLFLGGAAWYVLGQQGLVPSPRSTVAQLRPQVQSLSSDDLPLIGSSGQDASPADVQEATSSGSSDNSSSEEAGTEDDASSQTTRNDAADATPSSASQGLTPSEGGWTIVAGSRADRSAAESMVEEYRSTFSGRDLRVGLLSGNVDGETRYRIGVGQFESRADAEQALKELENDLPDGAWPFPL